MELTVIYVILFAIIVFIGQVFRKSVFPISLLLVITGMVLSFVPAFPTLALNPEVVLNIFLPILIYQISSFTAWKDIKKNFRPIMLLSVGHVIFITFVVAYVMHYLLPALGWPLCFVIGAVISPPDDVAIVSIAEKIRMPERVLTILEGEGMLNDATALIMFRFALAAVATHEFSAWHATSYFVLDVIGETLWGTLMGFVLGWLRTRIDNSMLHIVASFITPFVAYFPPEMLGGSGVLATVCTGFVIGNIYSVRFTPEFRLISRAVWPGMAFALQSILFLLMGLNLRSVLMNISTISLHSLLIYSGAVIATVVVGRFLWVYVAVALLPRLLFPSIRKRDPYPPWQFPLIISWAGLRGAISLAAALAVPTLPIFVEGANSRDLVVFLVFCVIVATLLLQGLTLPWLIKSIGLDKFGKEEKYHEHLAELRARLKMTMAVLAWLKEYKVGIKDNEKLLAETKMYIQQYKLTKTQLKERLRGHDGSEEHDEKAEADDEISFVTQLIEIEREALNTLWRSDKINLAIATRLLARLDHRTKHFEEE
jgi:Na+/H+ antiporter